MSSSSAPGNHVRRIHIQMPDLSHHIPILRSWVEIYRGRENNCAPPFTRMVDIAVPMNHFPVFPASISRRYRKDGFNVYMR